MLVLGLLLVLGLRLVLWASRVVGGRLRLIGVLILLLLLLLLGGDRLGRHVLPLPPLCMGNVLLPAPREADGSEAGRREEAEDDGGDGAGKGGAVGRGPGVVDGCRPG